MWDKCLYSDIQKEKFADFYFNIYNDDVLTSHEEYLDKLKKFYEDNKSVKICKCVIFLLYLNTIIFNLFSQAYIRIICNSSTFMAENERIRREIQRF